MASSSSDSASASFHHPKHEVFLSFRGVDTRNNFLHHLYDAFRRKGVRAYADFKELPRGEEISHALLQAIEESMISIIVFSQNYAASSWCLDELSKIMECWDSRRQLVVPIFYHVSPSDVRKQTGSFGTAFVEHERNRIDKVQPWKLALTKAGSLSGFTLTGDEPESIVIKDIVPDIVNKLTRLSKIDYNGFIGIGPQMEQIKSLLCIGGEDVRIIGIWGMGGIGKTILAKVLYDEVSAKFESHYFMANVRAESKYHGPLALRYILLSKLLNEENLYIDTHMIVPTFIKNRLCHKRVLVVLDDVNELEQLEILGINHNNFGIGSRIIITSRNKQVLTKTDVELIYEVKELSYNDSLQLFSLFAFKQNHPVDDFKGLSNSFLEHAKGVPLALKVLGSALHKKSMADWESALEGLKQCLDPKIQDVLKISYDELQVPEQNIFLDIACFFKDYHRDQVTKILENSHAGSTHFRISKLIDKCLLNVTNANTLGMHHLIQEMGRNIVLAESPYPEERSRLWTQDDVCQVLEYGGETKIQGMLLDQSQIGEIQLDPGAFARMRHLRIIKFYGKVGKLVPLDPGLESLPKELRCFHWEYCMLKSLPSKFCPEKLVELRLPHSEVEQLWNGKQKLVNLRVLDLYYCENLTNIPDLSAAINIETLLIDGCKSLVELPSMIHLKNLQRTLVICHCNNLKKFPELPRHIESLCLDNTGIEEIPDSISNLDQLLQLTLSHSRVKVVSKNINKLESLSRFELSDCPISLVPEVPRNLKSRTLSNFRLCNCPNISKFPNFPEIIKELDLSGTAIEEVPSSISRLKWLYRLILDNCRKMKSIPTSICELKYLKILRLSKTAIEEVPSSISELNLICWIMSSCTKLTSLPKSICCKPELRCKPLGFWHEGMNANRLLFNNCFNLDQDAVNNIVASTQHRLQCIAEEFTKERRYTRRDLDTWTNEDKQIYVFSCFPGSEIPETFKNRSPNSSITVQLSPACSSKRLMGFGLCVVADFKHNQELGLMVDYKVRFKTDCGDHHKFGSCFPSLLPVAVESNHVVVWFQPFHSGIVGTSRDKHFYEASFDFSAKLFCFPRKIKEQIEVQKCGVNLLYVDAVRSDDKEDEPSTNYCSDGEEEEDESSTYHSSDGEEEEDESRTFYSSDGEVAVDPTNKTKEPSCDANWSLIQDEENRCDASKSEPNSALGPNVLSLNCDVNNRDLKEDANDEEGPRDDPTTRMRARLKRRFGSDEEEEPDPQRPRYSH